MTLLHLSPASVLVATAVSVFAVASGNWLLCLFSILLWIFLALFFRDFYGIVACETGILVSPADGELMFARQHPTHLHIAIRLALWDRHVQIAPVSGIVHSVVHKAGEFNPAYLFEKTDLNERSEITVQSSDWGFVTVVLIAGQIANRIVHFVDSGIAVSRGDRLGLIKFGSRVDLVVPGTGMAVVPQPGEHVQLGQALVYKIRSQ